MIADKKNWTLASKMTFVSMEFVLHITTLKIQKGN